MARRYEHCYRSYSAIVPLRLALRALVTRSKLQKLSLLNRQRDYLALAGDDRRLALHRELNAILDRARSEWDSYDYGEGYFYQSLSEIGIRGLRDTAGRVAALDVRHHVSGRRVLEIGCNTGFVALSVAGEAAHVEGFDVNPFLVDIATAAARHLGIENVRFSTSSFESFRTANQFGAVLSLANHSTYDDNTRQSLEEYFARCYQLTEPGGRLLFESHPPEHEGPGLDRVCGIIDDLFEIEKRRVVEYGTFLDRYRTFIVARRMS